MGAEISHEPFDDNARPNVLRQRDLESVAEYIKSGACKRVVFMVGAGISTSAGIPDFRSPETGLYSNLARLNLPHPEAVFDISFFRENPIPFYTLAREIYPGKFRPTITHSFIKLFADKGLLLKCFTQNIDTLERAAGVPPELLVEAHGSFANQHCITCKSPYPSLEMQTHIANRTIPACVSCGGLVKPDITFFGEALPGTFHDNISLAADADLAIVMGSSLSVYPFASLPQRCGAACPRVLINMEKVGGLGGRLDDVLVLGECDVGVRKLAKQLGWDEELEESWRATETAVDAKNAQDSKRTEGMTKDQLLEEELNRLTGEMGESLRLADDKRDWVMAELERETEKEGGGELELLLRKSSKPVETKFGKENFRECGDGVPDRMVPPLKR